MDEKWLFKNKGKTDGIQVSFKKEIYNLTIWRDK